MKKLTLAAGAAVLAMGATALFAAPGDMGSRMGAELDADANGSVTRAEAQTAADAGWTRLDANKDGKLDPADRTARHAARFDRIDADNNGAISRAEFDAMHKGREGMKRGGHAGMAGHGGMAGHENMAGHGGGKMDGKGGHRMGGGGHGGGMLMMGKMADSNSDGAVSRAEFDAGVAKHFAMVDANNDGALDQAERQAAHQKMRATWKAQRPAPAATTAN